VIGKGYDKVASLTAMERTAALVEEKRWEIELW
jgi:hypothetical protein